MTDAEEHPDDAFREAWVKALYAAQAEICRRVEELEEDVATSSSTARFTETRWERRPPSDSLKSGGGGLTRVLQEGVVFSKAGVNVSAVNGDLPQGVLQSMCARHGETLKTLSDRVGESFSSFSAASCGEEASSACAVRDVAGRPSVSPRGVAGEETRHMFFAAGLSLVLHPVNPMAASVHLNFRFFQLFDAEGRSFLWWFGGGTDLSPCYVIETDCIAFHEGLKRLCDRHDPRYYPRFKTWCDAYFRLPHRGECRGVGGIFFDDLNEQMKGLDKIRRFCVDCLENFPDIYMPLVAKRCREAFSQQQLRWQQLRRGRYVEFNLLYDRGTKFGLQLPGSRVESILMSLPLTARWEYDVQAEDDASPEARSLLIFRNPVDWIEFDRRHLEGFHVPAELGRTRERSNE